MYLDISKVQRKLEPFIIYILVVTKKYKDDKRGNNECD